MLITMHVASSCFVFVLFFTVVFFFLFVVVFIFNIYVEIDVCVVPN